MISIVIIHWNTPDILRTQLQTLTSDEQLQIIVIDNASQESIDWIKKEFPTIQLIKNVVNRGYAFACNQGINHAKGEWILFLNPDVEITPTQIDEMVSQAKEQNIDACSPKTQENYQKPLPSTLSLLSEFSPMNRILSLNSFKEKTLFGGCLLARTDVMKKLGGWDERFFVWFEDSDLTKRLIDHNYKVGWVNVDIKHTGGTSFQKMSGQQRKDIFFHSMEVFAHKHFHAIGKMIVRMIKHRYTKRNVLPVLDQGASITIPNLKKDLLMKFLQENTPELQEVTETIIVTSALTSDEVWQLRKDYPLIRFIPIEKNEGFAKTVNIGFRVSHFQWTGTVNDDAQLTSGWVEKCIECSDDKTGAVNPVIIAQDGKVESAGINVEMKGKANPITTVDESTRSREVDAANAATVLYRHEALNEVGLFDERFSSYLEDIDLSLRLKRKGWKNIVCNEIKIMHQKHATSKDVLNKKKAWHDFRNWIFIVIKNWSMKDLIIHFLEILIERLRNFNGFLKSL